jgi:hypothetical protein
MRHSNLSAVCCLAFLFLAGVIPASEPVGPVITMFENGSPAHAQEGEPVLLFVEGLEPPVSVFFSDGSDPVLEATEVEVEFDRGIVLTRVPAGAATGDMKVTANGVDSDPYYLHIDAGTFTQGIRSVSGQVTDGTNPIADAAVVLFRGTGCDDEDFWDFAITDASGNYALNGIDGFYGLYVFPSLGSGLTVGGAEVMLESTPLVQDITLFPGIEVSGQVVFASMPGVGVPDCRVEFEGEESGFDTILTDANGDFTLFLPPGDYEQWVEPGAGALLASSESFVAIGFSSPQVLDDVALSGGVEISGLVRRQLDLEKLPGVEIGVQLMDTCCDSVDETMSLGDGSYSLIVPPNQTYSISVWIDDDQPYVDLNIWDVFVGPSGLSLNLDLEDAAFITGTLTDADTGSPLEEFQLEAVPYPWDGWSVAWAQTCMDGSYRLRVPPSAQGYVVGTNRWEETGYVGVTWNNTPEGTFFPCEGTAVPALTAGSETANINLQVPPGAGAISGSVYTQSSGCSELMDEPQWVMIDDGTESECGLGIESFMEENGTFRIFGLPHSGLVPSLRVCHYGGFDVSPQCYTLQQPPGYNPVVVAYGTEVSGVDFCLGNQPQTEIAGLRLNKSGEWINFEWSDSNDPYHDRYRLRGSESVVPSGGGSFPEDPQFEVVSEDYYPGTEISVYSPCTYFLVTDIGVTGVEGPSGSYGN